MKPQLWMKTRMRSRMNRTKNVEPGGVVSLENSPKAIGTCLHLWRSYLGYIVVAGWTTAAGSATLWIEQRSLSRKRLRNISITSTRSAIKGKVRSVGERAAATSSNLALKCKYGPHKQLSRMDFYSITCFSTEKGSYLSFQPLKFSLCGDRKFQVRVVTQTVILSFV